MTSCSPTLVSLIKTQSNLIVSNSKQTKKIKTTGKTRLEKIGRRRRDCDANEKLLSPQGQYISITLKLKQQLIKSVPKSLVNTTQQNILHPL